MKFSDRDSTFFRCLLLGMAANIKWSVPAWICLGGHFLLGWPMKLFRFTFGAWILCVMISMDIVGWLAGLAKKKDPPKENKNPYSGRYSPEIKDGKKNEETADKQC